MSLDSRTAVRSAFALLFALSLTACGTSQKPAESLETPAEEQTAPETTSDTSSEKEEATTTNDENVTAETTGSEDAQIATQRVGAEGIGFVDIPADWLPFKDVAGGTDLQWSDSSGANIITMNTFDMSSVPEENRASFDAMSAAQSVWANIQNDGAEDVTGAQVQLAGQTAYQVYGYYPADSMFLVAYCVADDAGTIHYVSVEGPAPDIMDNVARVEQSYAFTE